MIDSELAVLNAMPGNRMEITKRTGLNSRTVREITRRLVLHSHAHTCDYQPRANGGSPYPVFSRGDGVNAARTEPQTSSGRARKYKLAVEQDDFAEARAMILKRIDRQLASQAPATWFSSLLKASA